MNLKRPTLTDFQHFCFEIFTTFAQKNAMFNIFINDLYYGTECTFIKFAEDTKRGGLADKPDGCAI